ncbi:DUF805 domain-containing protein [Lysobacter sp. FW306-1B-D06B]|uniref:DUF805 domain-containing protein n=1 Tax=Lysobacter sp. FW306-1B-D06B TaxID=3140250 RepID=UPI0031409345
MNGINWFIKCLKQYTKFSGRARRCEFWWFVMIVWAISVAVKLGVALVAGAAAIRLVSGAVSLIFLMPLLAVSARRLHDIGKSGWFMLIPFYNFFLFVQNSMPGSNAYGANPKAQSA